LVEISYLLTNSMVAVHPSISGSMAQPACLRSRGAARPWQLLRPSGRAHAPAPRARTSPLTRRRRPRAAARAARPQAPGPCSSTRRSPARAGPVRTPLAHARAGPRARRSPGPRARRSPARLRGRRLR